MIKEGEFMEQFVLQQGAGGLWYGTFTHIEKQGITHGVSTRFGGVSLQPFHSLNLALHTGDEDKNVIENRHRFCKGVGIEADDIVTAEQTHGDQVFLVTKQHVGQGAKKYSESVKNTDALITNVPNIPLMLFFADCVPVLIVDPVHNAIGLAHAGWKGTVAHIGQKTILAMQTHFGTNPQDCLVGIAPSIGPCCYEVDHVVIKALQGAFSNWEELVQPSGDKWKLDLWQANCQQLEAIGVPSHNISLSKVCTECNHELFFSYRAENGFTGRIGAVMVL